jgi:uncharacterized protein with von Willebrand factor type A (vWA) domain
MDPHVRLMSELFSATKRATNFRELKTYYFHNAIYGRVFETEHFRDPIPVSQLIRECAGDRYHLILVGDAAMHPGELHSDGPWYRAHAVGDERLTALQWMYALGDHFKSSAWLNPDKPQYWYGTVEEIRAVFEMFPLTLEGLGDAIRHLSHPGRRRRRL